LHKISQKECTFDLPHSENLNRITMKSYKFIFLILSFFSCSRTILSQEPDSIKVLVKTFRGNEQRNYYGNEAPKNLKLIWKLNLGGGTSVVWGMPRVWSGAGWTGQPLLVEEKGKPYLIQGA
jgi:hypothetical protein